MLSDLLGFCSLLHFRFAPVIHPISPPHHPLQMVNPCTAHASVQHYSRRHSLVMSKESAFRCCATTISKGLFMLSVHGSGHLVDSHYGHKYPPIYLSRWLLIGRLDIDIPSLHVASNHSGRLEKTLTTFDCICPNAHIRPCQ